MYFKINHVHSDSSGPYITHNNNIKLKTISVAKHKETFHLGISTNIFPLWRNLIMKWWIHKKFLFKTRRTLHKMNSKKLIENQIKVKNKKSYEGHQQKSYNNIKL